MSTSPPPATPEFLVGPSETPDLILLGPAAASGSEGVLYAGRFPVTNGDLNVAVKMLQPGHLGRIEEWTRRWLSSVELLKRVRIPGLVAVRDGFVGPLPHPAGQADPTTASLYLIMDWVQGTSLDRWARTVTEAEPEQLLLSLVPVAVALDLLHSGAATDGVPIVHRDIKPANILIRPGGDTVLVDVGSIRDLSGDTRASGVVGTPGYIAPEVRADATYGPAADRYALGAVAFFLLTGSEPPAMARIGELRELLTSASRLKDRPEVVEHVLTMLNPEPEQRPTSLSNWVAQLRRSSLAMLPGDLALPPRAPSRHPSTTQPQERRSGLATKARSKWTLAAVASAAAAATVAGVIATNSPGPHHLTTKDKVSSGQSSRLVAAGRTTPTTLRPHPGRTSDSTTTASDQQAKSPHGPTSGTTSPPTTVPANQNGHSPTATTVCSAGAVASDGSTCPTQPAELYVCANGSDVASPDGCPSGQTATTTESTTTRKTTPSTIALNGPTTTTGTTTSTTTATTTTVAAVTLFAETTGSTAHTWTDYVDAGGSEGPTISSNETVQVTCKIDGFQVADGDTWWYKIASSPWDNNFYVSADAFYNNGQTSGPLRGTPFVDSSVSSC